VPGPVDPEDDSPRASPGGNSISGRGHAFNATTAIGPRADGGRAAGDARRIGGGTGPDGYLYWSTGDGGSADDPLYGAQNVSALLGKIVRIDAMRECDGRPYCIARTNPFATSAVGRPEIWAFGLRNPWRFSFDAADDSLWIADVGQNRWEEVNGSLPADVPGRVTSFGEDAAGEVYFVTDTIPPGTGSIYRLTFDEAGAP
jgi:hypothetical protein